MSDLTAKRCLPCEGGIPALSPEAAQAMLANLDHWDIKKDHREIMRSFHFKNFDETMIFVNSIAWMASKEGHHPDLEVSYSHVLVRYSTHAVGGLTENDFICAAKVDVIFKSFVY